MVGEKAENASGVGRVRKRKTNYGGNTEPNVKSRQNKARIKLESSNKTLCASTRADIGGGGNAGNRHGE